jgi:hypothetical protein
MITQRQFETKLIEAQSLEPMRFQLYDMGLRLVHSAYEIEAYVLILATWNFARFRFVMRRFDLDRFRKTVAAIAPVFQRLSSESFETTNLTALKSDIMEIYSNLKPLVEQTGASKLMHFKQPNLFIMWDTGIRKHYGVSRGASAEDYFDFLLSMKANFGHLSWTQTHRSFAKGIDEYNFALVHGKG